MTKFSALRATVCSAALVAATSASADVTAQEVWDNLKEQFQSSSSGELTIGSEFMSGATLKVDGIQIISPDPQMTMSLDLGSLALTENGDGTVTVDLADQIVIQTFETGVPDGAQFRVNVDLAGATMLVSGSAGDMLYESSADRYTISIAEAFEAGVAIPVELMININNAVTSQRVVDAGDISSLTSNFSADSLDYIFSAADDTTQFDMSGQSTGLSLSSAVDLPKDIDPEAADRLFLDGLSIAAQYSAATTASLANVTDETGTTTFTSTGMSGAGSLMMNKDRFSASVGVDNLASSINGGQIPFPIEVGATAFGLAFSLPVAKTDAPAEFSLGLNVSELTINDMVWAMADPMGALPHDPISAQLDTTGTLTMYYNLIDPADADALAQAPVPGELNSLSMNNLLLSALGATITGDGAFTFDNTDLVTFGGMPRPEGSVSLDGTGINALIDKLASLGMIPEEQLMGARMMLGMFSTVVGDDHITSSLEINAEGHIIVNGQRIQ